MPPILYEKNGRIALITINRPERRNALNFEAFGLLAKTWLDFRDDPKPRATNTVRSTAGDQLGFVRCEGRAA